MYPVYIFAEGPGEGDGLPVLPEGTDGLSVMDPGHLCSIYDIAFMNAHKVVRQFVLKAFQGFKSPDHPAVGEVEIGGVVICFQKENVVGIQVFVVLIGLDTNKICPDGVSLMVPQDTLTDLQPGNRMEDIVEEIVFKSCIGIVPGFGDRDKTGDRTVVQVQFGNKSKGRGKAVVYADKNQVRFLSQQDIQGFFLPICISKEMKPVNVL